MLSKSVQLNPTRYFLPDVAHTNPFFKNAKVGSCSKVLIKNGQALAVSFSIRNSKGRRLNHFRYYSSVGKNDFKSSYQQDYCIRKNMHVGMGKKPLCPYDPMSYRNRMPIDDFHVEKQRKNEFEMGDPGLINRKRWVSTSKDTYRKPMECPIANWGIVSDMAKQAHQRLSNIR